jgi:hypothetical protein
MKRAGAQVRNQCEALNRAGKVGEAARLQDIYSISHAACLSSDFSASHHVHPPPRRHRAPAVLHPGHLQSLIPHGQSSATPSARQAVGPLSLWWLVHPRDHWAPPTSPHEAPHASANAITLAAPVPRSRVDVSFAFSWSSGHSS